MKKVFQISFITRVILFFSVAVLFSYTNVSNAQDKNTFVSVIIIDKTKSMIGWPHARGTETDIWDDVQKFLLEYIDNVDPVIHLVIFEFAGDIYGPREFTLYSEEDKQPVKDYIRGIVPDGRSTAIYKALDRALDFVNNKYNENRKYIYLITDGRDNQSTITFNEVLQKFNATREEFDHLYYIDLMGTAPHDVINQIDADSNATIQKDFVIPTTLKVQYPIIPVIGGSGKSKQIFLLSDGKLDDNFSFRCLPETSPELSLNIDIRPSANIRKNNLIEIEENKYEYHFEVVLLAGNIDQPERVKVNLSAAASGNKKYYFQPSHFFLELRNRERPAVAAPKGGWR